MFDLLSPVAMYLADSVLSVIYIRSFLKEKYEKRGIPVIWAGVYFLIQILVFTIGADRHSCQKHLKYLHSDVHAVVFLPKRDTKTVFYYL